MRKIVLSKTLFCVGCFSNFLLCFVIKSVKSLVSCTTILVINIVMKLLSWVHTRMGMCEVDNDNIGKVFKKFRELREEFQNFLSGNN